MTKRLGVVVIWSDGQYLDGTYRMAEAKLRHSGGQDLTEE